MPGTGVFLLYPEMVPDSKPFKSPINNITAGDAKG